MIDPKQLLADLKRLMRRLEDDIRERAGTALIGQEAALFGFRNLAGWVAGKRADVDRRKAALEALFATNNHGYRLVSAGAYFGYVRHPFGAEPAAAVAKRLADQRNILSLPGSMFGPGQEACLRFAYANVPAEMIQVLDRRLGAAG